MSSFYRCIDKLALQGPASGYPSLSTEEKKELTRRWTEYRKVYDRYCTQHFYTRDLEKLADDIKCSVRAGGHNLEQVVAGICALWSLASCPAGDSAMMEPHCEQILAIFRLLGLEKGVASSVDVTERAKLLARHMGKSFLPTSLNQLLQAPNLTESHLIQVKTGEGKSVLLGVLSTLLAVMGCEVDCVCYSQYLSRRDKAAFKKVFDAFEVTDRVNYGTFHELAEQRINYNGNLTDTALGVKSGGCKEAATGEGEAPRILLIDDVDVFFSADFFGETYDPLTTFNAPEVEEIQRYIWEHRSETDGLAATVKSLDAYKRLLATYPDLKKVIDEHTDCMVTDVHKVVSNKLTKEKWEAANGKVNPYTYILGVTTGTLECLGEYEQLIIRDDYGIKAQSVTPSSYGDTRLDFTPPHDVVIKQSKLKQAKVTELLKSIEEKEAAVRGATRDDIASAWKAKAKVQEREAEDGGSFVLVEPEPEPEPEPESEPEV
jgi:hypothetical protein